MSCYLVPWRSCDICVLTSHTQILNRKAFYPDSGNKELRSIFPPLGSLAFISVAVLAETCLPSGDWSLLAIWWHQLLLNYLVLATKLKCLSGTPVDNKLGCKPVCLTGSNPHNYVSAQSAFFSLRNKLKSCTLQCQPSTGCGVKRRLVTCSDCNGQRISRFWLKFRGGHLEELHSPVTPCGQCRSLSPRCGALARSLCEGRCGARRLCEGWADVELILTRAHFLSIDSFTVPDARLPWNLCYGKQAVRLSSWDLHASLLPLSFSSSFVAVQFCSLLVCCHPCHVPKDMLQVQQSQGF